MSVRKMLGAAALALAVTLAPVNASTIAHAAPASQTAETRQQVTKAEQYLVSQLTKGSYVVPSWQTDGTGDPSTTIDVLLGLSASGQQNPTVQKMATWLKTQTAYVTSAGSVAKMTLAAVASGADPRDFGGKNLIDTILTETPKLPADNAFSAALAVVALDAADVKVPDAVLTPVTRDQQDDGGFKSYDKATSSDPDTTALVIQALANHRTDATQPVFDKALDYLEGSVKADGSFGTFSPANTAGLAIPALNAAKSAKAETVRAWLTSHQLADGGYSNTAKGTKSDAYATAAALLGLENLSFADVTVMKARTASSITPSASASPTPPEKSSETQTTDRTTSTKPSPTRTPKASSRPGTLPETGADGTSGIVLVALTLVAGGVALRRITK